MDKEFIIDENTKSLVFVKDTEPAQVYLNGTLVEGMSAVKSSIATVDQTLSYQSEYKKNLLELDIEGNTYQKQLQGYNLFDWTVGYNSSGRVTIVKKENGSVTIRPQVNNATYISITYPIKKEFEEKFTIGSKVTISANCKQTDTNCIGGIRLQWFNGATALQTYGIYAETYMKSGQTEAFLSKTGTVSKLPNFETYPNARLCLALYANQTGTGSTETQLTYSDMQVLIGDTVLPFEEFCGGIPSPNPSYPQEIQNADNMSAELSTNDIATTVQIPTHLASQDKLLVNYIDKSVNVNREYVKLNLADLTWNYGISSSTNITYFYLYLPYEFTGTGYFNRGKVGTVNNTELNELTNTIIVQARKVGTLNELEIAFSPDFDLKAEGKNYGDVNKLMAWLEANPCEVLLKISSDLEETYTGETWASELLNLPTQNATNTITITSSIPTSKLSVDYAEWGGRDE